MNNVTVKRVLALPLVAWITVSAAQDYVRVQEAGELLGTWTGTFVTKAKGAATEWQDGIELRVRDTGARIDGRFAMDSGPNWTTNVSVAPDGTVVLEISHGKRTFRLSGDDTLTANYDGEHRGVPQDVTVTLKRTER